MSERASHEVAKIRSIAREYQRLGYTVRQPSPGDELPAFLHGLRPDLIVERDDDRAVVEVKASHSLQGNNQLKVIADRIDGQPGWRFELVTVSEGTEPSTDQAADSLAERIGRTFDLGYGDAALLAAFGAAEELLRDVARATGSRSQDWSAQRLAHRLVTQGVLSREDYEILAGAQRWRDRVVHGLVRDEVPERTDVERLLTLGDILRKLAKSKGSGSKPPVLDRAA